MRTRPRVLERTKERRSEVVPAVIVLAHISDLHLDGQARAHKRAARVIDYLNGLTGHLDAVLVTGDLADHGLPDEYEEVRDLLVGPHPFMTCPGNHDVRPAYRKVLLGEDASGEPINRVHVLDGLAIAMCDSSIPGRDDGLLAEQTLTWLDASLAEVGQGMPALVAFHHPPTLLHVPFIDRIRQFGEERLAELIEAHPQVLAVLCGHAHTPAATAFAGRPLLVAPGVVSTLTLPWEAGQVVNLDLPPAVAFHVLD